jgi:peptidyl-prolyl cis-trans isomerase C
MTEQNNEKKTYGVKLMGVSLAVVAAIGFGAIYMQKSGDTSIAQNETTMIQAENDVNIGEDVMMNDIAPVAGENPVVAIVNGVEIKRSDVEPLMEQALQGQMGQLGVGMDQLFPLFLDQYVSGELVLQQAKKADIEDRDLFKTQMQTTREQIMRNVFLVEMADQKVTEDALRKLYDEKVANVPDAEEIKASHILLKEEEDAKAVIKSLQDGSDFAELAKEKSTGPTGPKGGDLGYFTKSDMVAEFADAAFEMEKGSFSDTPVKTQFGWHVIQVTDKRVRPKPSFDEVKEQLEGALRKQILDTYLSDVRSDADVTLFDYNGNPLPEEAAAPAAGSNDNMSETELKAVE